MEAPATLGGRGINTFFRLASAGNSILSIRLTLFRETDIISVTSEQSLNNIITSDF
jgi:hypothetical protein